jgi:hypothetical protein
MSVAKRLEIRKIIKFCAGIGKTPTDIYKELKKQTGPIQCHEGWFCNGINAL